MSGVSSASLLYVDDCTDLVELVSFMLASKGWNVDVAEDGVQAVKMLDMRSYDLILLDLQMPNMDGLEFLQWKREQKIDTPVVMYTSHDDAQTKSTLQAAGAASIVYKPLKIDALISELELHLKK